jgi:hypothetical protein
LYLFCHDIGTDARRLDQPCRKGKFFFYRRDSLGAVLQRRGVSDVVIQQSHLQDMLLHSGPLGLAHRLLDIELLPFSCVSTEDCELM